MDVMSARNRAAPHRKITRSAAGPVDGATEDDHRTAVDLADSRPLSAGALPVRIAAGRCGIGWTGARLRAIPVL
jgi:hypothetical protein